MPWRRMGKWSCISTILDLGPRWEWSASHPGHFNRTQLIRGWVGFRAVVSAVRKREYLIPAGNRTPAVKLVACRYTDWAIPALHNLKFVMIENKLSKIFYPIYIKSESNYCCTLGSRKAGPSLCLKGNVANPSLFTNNFSYEGNKLWRISYWGF
jgi:hypothetical protein